MKANELRLGNIIYFPFTSENVVINGLALKEERNTTLYIQSTCNKSQYFALPEQYNPILISEEWLKKFGFKFGKFLQISTYTKGIVSIMRNDKGNFFFYPSIKVSWDVEIKYVHQLQNLYFALCGEELAFSSTEP